jgi:hypothetical protein
LNSKNKICGKQKGMEKAKISLLINRA